jgi:hypothetical protein
MANLIIMDMKMFTLISSVNSPNRIKFNNSEKVFSPCLNTLVRRKVFPLMRSSHIGVWKQNRRIFFCSCIHVHGNVSQYMYLHIFIICIHTYVDMHLHTYSPILAYAYVYIHPQ